MFKIALIFVVLALSVSVLAQVGSVDRSVLFSGTGDNKIQKTDSQAWNVKEFVFTITFWIKTTNTEGTIFEKINNKDKDEKIKIYLIDGKVRFRFQLKSDEYMITYAANTINDGNWHYIACARHDYQKIWLSTDYGDKHSATGTGGDKKANLNGYFCLGRECPIPVSDYELEDDEVDEMIESGANPSDFGFSAFGDGPFAGQIDQMTYWGTPLIDASLRLNSHVSLPPYAVGTLDILTFDVSPSASSLTTAYGTEFSVESGVSFENGHVAKVVLNQTSAGKALKFAKDSTTLCQTGVFDSETKFTVEFLIMPDKVDDQTWYMLAYKTSTLLFNFKLVCLVGEHGCAIMIEIEHASKGSMCFLMEDSIGVRPQVWHNVAVSIDLDSSVIKAYVDGTVAAGGACSTGSFSSGDGSYFVIGNRYVDDTDDKTSYRGFLDELRIWNVIRTQKQILSTMDVALSSRSPNLIAYYNFDDADSSLTGFKDIVNSRDCIRVVPISGTVAPQVVTSSLVLFSTRATIDSIPGPFSPSSTVVGTSVTLSLPGLRMDPLAQGSLTAIAFVKDEYNCSDPDRRVAYQVISGTTAPSSITLSSGIQSAGYYSACVSVDGGLTFAKQSLAKLQVLGADSTVKYVTAISPSPIGIGSMPNITVTGEHITRSSTTAISFAKPGNCVSGPRNGTTLLTETSTTAGPVPNSYVVTLSSSIVLPDTYKVCYTVNGVDWLEQEPKITTVAATPTDITQITPSVLGTGGETWITLTGATTTPTTYVAFAVSGQCNTQNKYGMVAIATSNHTVSTTVSDANSYRLCYSVNGLTWFEQSSVGFITVVPPTDSATISPTVVAGGVVPTLTISGPSVTETSMIGFSLSSTCSVSVGVQSITKYTGGSLTLSDSLWSNGTVMYQLCFSTDNGLSWGVPSGTPSPTIEVVQARNTTITTFTPSTIWTGTTPSITFTGAKATQSTKLAFAPAGQCHLSGSRVGLTSYQTDGAVSLGVAISASGTYVLCYSSDGTTFFEQSKSGIPNMKVYASATSTTITDFSPKVAAIGTTVPFSATGGVYHPPYSKIAFALPGLCGIYQYRSNVTTVPNSWSGVNVGMPKDTDFYAICYTADGSTWVEQDTLRLQLVDASTSSISSVDSVTNPTFITTTTSAVFDGSVGTPTTAGFFVTQGSGYNCGATRHGDFTITSGTSSSDITAMTTGDYYLCYSVDSVNYYPQLAIRVTVSNDLYLGKVKVVKFGANKCAKVGMNARPLVRPEYNTGANPVFTTGAGIAFAPVGDANCNSAQGKTEFNSVTPQTMGNNALYGWGSNAGINAKGTYAVCFEDSAASHDPSTLTSYSKQVGVNIEVVAANTDSITELSVTIMGAGSRPNIKFTGAQSTPDTIIAFTSGSDCTSRVAETPLNDDAYEGQAIQIGAAISTAATYSVCYTVGNGWVKQTLAGVSLKVIEAASDSITALSPDYIAVNRSLSMAFTGAEASPQTKIAFALPGQCSTPSSRISETAYTSAGSLTMSPISVVGNYSICYSTNGVDFVEQSSSPSLKFHIVSNSPTVATSISVTKAGAGTRPTITFSGIIVTPSTSVAFALPGQCNSGPRIGTVDLSSGTTAQLSQDLPSSPTMTNVEYKLCLSMSPWVEQTTSGTSLTVVSALSSSISAISPPVIGADSSPMMTFTGAPALSTTKIAFALPGQCSTAASRVAETPYTSAGPLQLSTVISTVNQYKACLSVDGGSTWIEQTVGIVVTGATATSITDMSPTTIAAFSKPTMNLLTVVGTPTTYIGFSTDNCVTRSALTAINTGANPAAITLTSSITDSGTYYLCYTVNNVTWVKQTTPAVALTVVRSKSDAVSTISPGFISVLTKPVFTLKAGPGGSEDVVTTSSSMFAFAEPGKCGDSAARNGTTAFPVSQPVALGQEFTSATRVKLCFTAGGTEWVEQTPWLNVTKSEPDMVAWFSPAVVGVNTAPQFLLKDFAGIVLQSSPTSRIAFAPAGQCNNPSLRQAETDYKTTGPVNLASKFVAGGYLRLCVSMTDGAWYEEQTNAPLLQVASALNSSLTAVSPYAIEKDTRGPLNFTGLVPSATTQIAIAYPGQCQVGRFSATRISAAGTVTLSSDVAVDAVYSYCYSVDDGETWVEQILPGIKLVVQDCLTLKSCTQCQATSHCRWCLDSNVCSVSRECTGTLASTGSCPAMADIDSGKTGSILGDTLTVVSGNQFVDTSATSKLKYMCAFGSSPSIVYANATRVDNTHVSCYSPPWASDDTTTLTVYLGSTQYTSNMKSVVYYDCSAYTAGCGSCYSSSRDQCGWCMQTGVCQVARQCTAGGNLFGGSACATITKLSPSQSEIAGGGKMTVTGTLFINSPDLYCRFGNKTAVTKYVSPTQVECTIPSTNAAGTIEVDLWYKHTNRAYTGSKSFFYVVIQPPPDLIVPITASSGAVVAVMGALAFILWRRHKKAQIFAPPKLTRSFLDEILFKPPKLKPGAIGLASLLSDLEALLCRRDAAELRFAIAGVTQATEMDMAARSFVHMLLSQKVDTVVKVIMEFISHEVKVAQSQTTLFRTNSFATKLFNFYSKVVGVPLLHKALGYVLNEAVATSGNVEVDSSRRTDGEGDDPMARFQLLLVNQKVLKSIMKAEVYVPADFRALFHHLQTVIRERFPIRPSELASIIYERLGEDLAKTKEAFSVSKDDHDQLMYIQSSLTQSLDSLKGSLEPMIHHFQKLNGHINDMGTQLQNTTSQVEDLLGALDPETHAARRLMAEAQEQQNSIAIGGFFFLRFLVPAVTTPESYGILKEPPNPEQRRLLVLVAKVLQNLSNNVEFGRKEEYMTKLNDFLRSNHNEINKLFDRLADPERETKPLRVPKVRVPTLHHDAAIVSLYQHIQTNFEKIMTKLEEDVDGNGPDPARLKLADELADVMKPISDSAAKFDVGRPLKKGWMTKEGGKIKTWKERFFVLKSNVLQYYKDEKDKQPKGVIMLSEVLRVEVTADYRDEDDDEFCFAVITEGRTYHIYTDSKSERQAWIQAINDALAKMREMTLKESSRRSTRQKSTADLGVGVGVGARSSGVPDETSTEEIELTEIASEELWYRTIDANSNRTYFINAETQETTWEEPKNAKIVDHKE